MYRRRTIFIRRTLRLSRKKTEDTQTTGNFSCAGLTARGSVHIQQLPSTAGAQFLSAGHCGCPVKKRKIRKRRKTNHAPDCRGALARCVAMERQRNPEKPVGITGCARIRGSVHKIFVFRHKTDFL